jgi:hypothetical protein
LFIIFCAFLLNYLNYLLQIFSEPDEHRSSEKFKITYAILHLWTRVNQSITKEVAAANEAGHGSYFLQCIGMRAPSLLSIYNIKIIFK